MALEEVDYYCKRDLGVVLHNQERDLGVVHHNSEQDSNWD